MRMKYVAQLVVKSVMGPMEFVGLGKRCVQRYALFALRVAYLAGAKMSFRLYVADSRRGYTL